MSWKNAAMIDLRPDYLETVKRILAEYVPGYEVRAFGSRVTGIAKEYSDLDIVIITDQLLPVRKIARLKEAFAESRLPFKVDVVDYVTINEPFRSVVLKSSEVIQKRDETDIIPSRVNKPFKVSA